MTNLEHQREVFALNNGATDQAARDFAIDSDATPTIREYCKWLTQGAGK